jgi:hypothetical protein
MMFFYTLDFCKFSIAGQFESFVESLSNHGLFDLGQNGIEQA